MPYLLGFTVGRGKKKLWKKLPLNDIVILQVAAPNRNRRTPRVRSISLEKFDPLIAPPGR